MPKKKKCLDPLCSRCQEQAKFNMYNRRRKLFPFVTDELYTSHWISLENAAATHRRTNVDRKRYPGEQFNVGKYMADVFKNVEWSVKETDEEISPEIIERRLITVCMTKQWWSAVTQCNRGSRNLCDPEREEFKKYESSAAFRKLVYMTADLLSQTVGIPRNMEFIRKYAEERLCTRMEDIMVAKTEFAKLSVMAVTEGLADAKTYGFDRVYKSLEVEYKKILRADKLETLVASMELMQISGNYDKYPHYDLLKAEIKSRQST